MQRKPKFRPTITKVKLEPEQTVLSCLCYNVNRGYGGTGGRANANRCQNLPGGGKTVNIGSYWQNGVSSS